MFEVNVCSLGVQLEILQCEEVLTALFVIETQLEWVSSSSLIMRPLPLSSGFSLGLSLLSLSRRFSCCAVFHSPPACNVEPTAGGEGTREGWALIGP